MSPKEGGRTPLYLEPTTLNAVLAKARLDRDSPKENPKENLKENPKENAKENAKEKTARRSAATAGSLRS